MVQINDKFNNWTIVGDKIVKGKGKRGSKTYIPCRCCCGKEKLVLQYDLFNNKSKGCGCNKSLNRFKNKCLNCLIEFDSPFEHKTICQKCVFLPTRPCIKCKNIKQSDEFRKRKNGISAICTDCTKLYNIELSRTPEARYSNSKRKAIKRGLTWNLSLDDFEVLIKNNCCYCGRELNKDATGSTLDRKNNRLGYSLENVVPCCPRCNSVKMDYFTYEEMLQIGVKIAEIDMARLNKPNEQNNI